MQDALHHIPHRLRAFFSKKYRRLLPVDPLSRSTTVDLQKVRQFFRSLSTPLEKQQAVICEQQVVTGGADGATLIPPKCDDWSLFF
jgi:hypothetical protein